MSSHTKTRAGGRTLTVALGGVGIVGFSFVLSPRAQSAGPGCRCCVALRGGAGWLRVRRSARSCAAAGRVGVWVGGRGKPARPARPPRDDPGAASGARQHPPDGARRHRHHKAAGVAAGGCALRHRCHRADHVDQGHRVSRSGAGPGFRSGPAPGHPGHNGTARPIRLDNAVVTIADARGTPGWR